jgi:hypothetical protein
MCWFGQETQTTAWFISSDNELKNNLWYGTNFRRRFLVMQTPYDPLIYTFTVIAAAPPHTHHTPISHLVPSQLTVMLVNTTFNFSTLKKTNKKTLNSQRKEEFPKRP